MPRIAFACLCAVALALLQGGDVLLSAVAQIPQLVELGIVARANDATVGRQGGRPVGERIAQRLGEIG